MSLPRFAVRQVVLVNLIFVFMMLAGAIIVERIPVDVFPDISFNAAEITTVWLGASPGDVERLVTQKIEDEIEDITGIKEMFSFSSQGLSRITIEWDETLGELEYESAVNDLRAAIDRVQDLPADAETPYIVELSVSEVYNICIIALADAGGVGEHTLREVARDLRDHLEQIPDLRKAELRGVRDRELRVSTDRARLVQYDLTLTEIADVIARSNRNFAGGTMTSAGSQEITVRGLGEFASPAELAATVVRKSPDGRHVRLRDVADVQEGFEKRLVIGRYNGHPAVNVGISKESDADVMELVAQVRAALDEFRPRMPPGIEATLTWDTSEYVGARLEIMRSNLLLGVVLVVFLLWLTVGFRNALLAVVGVPFSFLTALLLFPLLDITINSLSLVGFVMVSGMLVDDAIIILENVYRHVESGTPLREAIVAGTEEVMWPVVAAVLTTVAAFIPMLTISGTSGEFMSILPKTVIVCLLGSLFEALVILPAHYLDWGSRRTAADALAAGAARRSGLRSLSYRARAAVDRALAGLRELFLRGQRHLLHHRWTFLALSVGALLLAAGLFTRVPVNLFPSDFNNLIVTLEAPTDYGLEQTDGLSRGIEEALASLGGEITDYSTNVGFGFLSDEIPVVGANYATFFLSFPNTRENIAHPTRVLDLVRARLDEHRRLHPQGIVNLTVVPPRNGPPVGKPVAIRIVAEDYRVAKQIAEEMKMELARLAGVYNIEDNVPIGPRELRVRPSEDRASLHGLTFDAIGRTLAAANDGLVASSFRDPNADEDVDIRVQLDPAQRRTVQDLLEVEARAPDGHRVEVGEVARVELERGYQRLYHYGAERAVVVYADVDGESATSISVNEHMRARFAGVPLRFSGVNLIYGGEFQATDDAFADMQRALLLAVIAIYAILAAQFRSYLQPFIVMSVIVFSFIGVAFGLFALSSLMDGYALSMYVLYGMVGLAGIVVNDSLVLIDFVNQARRRGAAPWEAVREASRKRFRPILLTTLTTVLGLAPMALGLSGYSMVFGPFAASIVFGLAVASGLTLFVVPALYLTLEDARARWTPGRAAPAGEDTPPAPTVGPRAA